MPEMKGNTHATSLHLPILFTSAGEKERKPLEDGTVCSTVRRSFGLSVTDTATFPVA